MNIKGLAKHRSIQAHSTERPTAQGTMELIALVGDIKNHLRGYSKGKSVPYLNIKTAVGDKSVVRNFVGYILEIRLV